MILSALLLALSSPALPADAGALACNPSGPRPQHCGSGLADQSAPAAGKRVADAPRQFCHPDPSKNRGCTREHPHADALALRAQAAQSDAARR
ncbi:hypothetical protein OLX02_11370 [Novosphingobium sp. KCTC 2891]|uniref:hypothetical protein n=1 Tax=Novosphingobium sp. KCTC 2891 TaxID=2989730 RepID=UPI0022218DBE|nr:hypothetical protein [Novosphingobium sp. KCTC 2891]MCW1383420.1 hypothetical protein [Novosphingobium sp. KCTC 2891]